MSRTGVDRSAGATCAHGEHELPPASPRSPPRRGYLHGVPDHARARARACVAGCLTTCPPLEQMRTKNHKSLLHFAESAEVCTALHAANAAVFVL